MNNTIIDLSYLTIVKNNLDVSWKAERLKGKEVKKGYFVLGINYEKGEQITKYIPISYWDTIDVTDYNTFELYDGHSEEESMIRLNNLILRQL